MKGASGVIVGRDGRSLCSDTEEAVDDGTRVSPTREELLTSASVTQQRNTTGRVVSPLPTTNFDQLDCMDQDLTPMVCETLYFKKCCFVILWVNFEAVRHAVISASRLHRSLHQCNSTPVINKKHGFLRYRPQNINRHGGLTPYPLLSSLPGNPAKVTMVSPVDLCDLATQIKPQLCY